MSNSDFQMKAVVEEIRGMDRSEHFLSHAPVLEYHSQRIFWQRKQQECGRIVLHYFEKSLGYFEERIGMRHFMPYYFFLKPTYFLMHTVVHSTYSNAVSFNTCDMSNQSKHFLQESSAS